MNAIVPSEVFMPGELLPVPAHRRYRGDSGLLSVTNPGDLRLGLEFNARAVILNDPPPQQVVAEAAAIEAEIALKGFIGLTFHVSARGEVDEVIQGLDRGFLPDALENHIAGRAAVLRDIASADKGGRPEDYNCRVSLLGRLVEPGWHRDGNINRGALYVETLIGAGTKVASDLSERREWLTRFHHHRLGAGQGILMNLESQGFARHSSPEQNLRQPRLAAAMVLSRKRGGMTLEQ